MHPLSDRLQASLRFLHHPLPSAASDDLAIVFVCRTGQTPHRAYPVPRKEHESEGSRLFADDRLSAYPHQAGGYPITCRFGQSPILQITFGSLKLDDVYSGSHYADPVIQPSASRECDSRAHVDPSRGLHSPWGRLHCRCASHRTVTGPALHLGYWRLNARSSSGQMHPVRQLSTRLAPQVWTYPHSFGLIHSALVRRLRVSGAAVQQTDATSGRTLGKLLLYH